jgi:hypothetical protein
MKDLGTFLPFVIFAIAVASVLRNVAKAMRNAAQQQPPTRSPADFDPEVAARTRRIQEEIRRKIAERRGLVVPTEPAPSPEPEEMYEPPVIHVESTPVEPAYAATQAAIMERQQQLSDQMRALEASRVAQLRKAAHVAAADAAVVESGRDVAMGSRADFLGDLRDPGTLRRAFVLREVLGPPVGLK